MMEKGDDDCEKHAFWTEIRVDKEVLHQYVTLFTPDPNAKLLQTKSHS